MLLRKKVFGLHSVIINSYTLSRRDCAYHLSHAMKIEDKVLQNKEKIKLPQHDGQSDKQLEDLNSRSMSKVLLYLESKHINGSLIVAAVKNVFKYHRTELENNQISRDLTDDQFFKQITLIVNLNIDKTTASEAFQILKLYTRMNVPVSSNMLTPILERISLSINDLSFIEYNELRKLIYKCKDVPITKKILKELRRTFITKVSLEFDENNIEHFVNTLSFISNQLFFKPDLFKIFMNKLKNFNGLITVENSILIVESISKMRDSFEPSWSTVIHRLTDIIIQNIDQLNIYQINYILFSISGNRHTHCLLYNENLVDKLINKIISDDAGFELGLSALKCIGYMRHRSTELLNYICVCYFEKISLNNEKIPDEYGKLLTLIFGLSNAKHKPKFWNTFRHYFLNNNSILEKINSDEKDRTLCFVALHLLQLDCCHPSILQKIFQDDYFFQMIDKLAQWSLLKVYQILKTTDDYNGPWPTEFVIKSFPDLIKRHHKLSQRTNGSIRQYLISGLGDSIYVKSKISTKLFHPIDHVVAFDNHNNPLPICKDTIQSDSNNQERLEYLEDLQFPPDSQVVLLVTILSAWRYRNHDQILANFEVILNTLRKVVPKSYSILTINMHIWASIPEKNKTLYIMDQVKSKLNSNKIIKETV